MMNRFDRDMDRVLAYSWWGPRADCVVSASAMEVFDAKSVGSFSAVAGR
jgi:hypothetical protein